jgi:hypothetical protein
MSSDFSIKVIKGQLNSPNLPLADGSHIPGQSL